MSPAEAPIAKLALADGTVFSGTAFGYIDAPQPVPGEVVFNTAMTGYQEILTDPSYAGQIVTMTYTQIGNYGVAPEDMESERIHVAGFVVRELANVPSNYRASACLEDWLAEQRVLGIAGIDTRALTRKLRIDGAINGVLSVSELDDERLVALARAVPSMAGQNLAVKVSRTDTGRWDTDLGDWEPIQGAVPPAGRRLRVVAIDCGVKQNILRNLVERGC
jgi:carbamoyl-phosphate synthase small subunit